MPAFRPPTLQLKAEPGDVTGLRPVIGHAARLPDVCAAILLSTLTFSRLDTKASNEQCERFDLRSESPPVSVFTSLKATIIGQRQLRSLSTSTKPALLLYYVSEAVKSYAPMHGEREAYAGYRT
eukprot:scaffold17032_cov34-Prasinocladus_malaysianus.AAC.1